MRLEVSKQLDMATSPEACWRLISDVPRLSGCIPGVTDVQEIEPGRAYSATVSDKLGPFRLQLPVRITIAEREEPRRLAADLAGNDGRAQARVQGRLEATLEAAGAGAKLSLSMRLDVLGRLAALGATPMRRRAEEIFGIFASRVQDELSAAS